MKYLLHATIASFLLLLASTARAAPLVGTQDLQIGIAPVISTAAAIPITRNIVGMVAVDFSSTSSAGQIYSNAILYSSNTYLVDIGVYEISGTANGSIAVLRVNGDSAANYLWAATGIQTANAAIVGGYQGAASATNTAFNFCYAGTLAAGSWCKASFVLSSVPGITKSVAINGTSLGFNLGNYDYQQAEGGSYAGSSTSYTIAVSTYNGSTAINGWLRISQVVP